MTLDELMAIVSSSTRAGTAATGTTLVGQAAEERSNIRAADREFDEGVLESEAYAEEQAEKNAKLRAAGAVIGFLFGGPAGAGLGSATARTIFGGRDTPTVAVSTKPGMFYSQTRKDQASNFKSTNDFIKRANERFTSDVLYSAATDAFTGYRAAKAFPGLTASPEWVSSRLPWNSPAGFSFEDMFKFDPTNVLPMDSTSAPLLDIGILDTPTRIVDPSTGFGAGNTPLLYDPMTGLKPKRTALDELMYGRID